MDLEFKYSPSGDNGIMIKFKDEISEAVNNQVNHLAYLINNSKLKDQVELIPAYNSILVIYNQYIYSYDQIIGEIMQMKNKNHNQKRFSGEIIEIPTLYGGEYGQDLEYVARHNNLSIDEVIKIHSETNYPIYMIGFTPGFPYLGGMSEKIATARLESPRKSIQAGSVGIAGNQTGIYPLESPGGWRIIGRTPIKLFDLDRKPEVLLKQGDYIRFVPIDEEQYKNIEKEIKENKYKIIKRSFDGC